MVVLATDKESLSFLVGKTVVGYESVRWDGEKGIDNPYCFELRFSSGNRLLVRPIYDIDGSYLVVELDSGERI